MFNLPDRLRSRLPMNRRECHKVLDWVIPLLLLFLRELRLGAADHFDYKFEYYGEERDRVQILTHTALFETSLTNWLSLKGSVVYDGISGATPTGGPPLHGTTQVPTAEIRDARYAGILAPSFKWGGHTFTPQLAVSVEDDYESMAPSLNYQLDFNRRNTALNLGVAHNIDRKITGDFVARPQQKDATDFLLGLSQVLTPTTLANVTLTLGTAHGYLSDPYKGFRFRGYPVESVLFPEQRPGHRTKQILTTSLNQFFEPVNGSADLTYRFYHDSFGIYGHTVTLEWLQNIGSHLVVAPLFRYYEQSAADFYLLSFDADPSDSENPNNALVPPHYSSDYRLSRLRTFTYGVSATVKVRRWLLLDAAWKRYEMAGLDGVTSPSAYPRANIYTLGLRLNF
jgi:hypothetical protein